jgi:hypothetical protein
MGEAAELTNSLPLSFKTPMRQEHIGFLRDLYRLPHFKGTLQR